LQHSVAWLLVVLALPSVAAADVDLKTPELRKYPEVALTVVTSKRTARPPQLREQGRTVAGLTAENLGRAKSVVLAIDRSQSMRGRALRDATAGARAFIAAKPPSDRIAVVSVGRRAQQLSRFSSATIDADIALREIGADRRYGTALYDSVVLSARALRSQTLAGRVLILLTDGQEVSSRASLAEAIEAARKADVAVYPIGIESPKFSPAPLQTLAGQTGGTYYGAASSAALAGVYRAIAAELQRTWRLHYVTAARPGDRLHLEATAAGSGTGALDVVVPGESAGSPGKPSRLLPGWAYESTVGSLAIGLTGGALVLLAFALVGRARQASWVRTRLAPHVEHERRATQGKKSQRFESAVALMGATERAFGGLRFWLKVHRLLERADVPLRTVEFLYIAAASAFLTGLVAAVSGRSTTVILLALVGGAAIPFAFVWFKARRRLAAFEDQLPDLLLTIAASLKAGHSFKQGLQTIADEGQPPASKEFSRALAESRLGRPVDDALEDMANRVGSKNLEFVVTAVGVQGQVGGSLAGLFDMVAEAVRNRQQFARKIKGLTAMGRASAYVLVALPFVLAAVITLLNRQYMDPLWNTSTGHKLVIGMCICMAFGALVLKRIVAFRG